MRAGTAWRILICFSALVSTLAILAGVYFFTQIANAAQQNRETICALGRFLTIAEPVRLPNVSRESYVAALAITDAYLSQLQEIDCASVGGIGKEVTPDSIEAQRRDIQAEIKQQNSRIEEHGGTSPVPEPEVGQTDAGRNLGDEESSPTSQVPPSGGGGGPPASPQHYA